jgi:iron complex transport system ATP-binding protein
MINPVLSMRDVSVSVGRKTLVSNASLDLAPGEMVGLLGPNGAGKSSLLRTIYRNNRPATGTVKVQGKDVWSQTTTWVAQRVGAVLQDAPADFPLTVRDIIAMGRSAHKGVLASDTVHDFTLIEAAIKLLELADLEHQRFQTLSGGERQRVLLARAFVQQPALLVLDEPTNHLDIRHQLSLLRFVREIGTATIAALHDLNLAAMFCDRICLMQAGQIVAIGTPEDVLTRARIEQVYGVEMDIQKHPKTGRINVLPV